MYGTARYRSPLPSPSQRANATQGGYRHSGTPRAPRRLRCRLLLAAARPPRSLPAPSQTPSLRCRSARRLRCPLRRSTPLRACHAACMAKRLPRRAPSPPLRREARRPRRRQKSGPGCCAGVVKHSGVYARPAKRWPGTHAGRHAHNRLRQVAGAAACAPAHSLFYAPCFQPVAGPTRWKHRSGIRALARGVALSQREARPTGAEKARCPRPESAPLRVASVGVRQGILSARAPDRAGALGRSAWRLRCNDVRHGSNDASLIARRKRRPLRPEGFGDLVALSPECGTQAAHRHSPPG